MTRKSTPNQQADLDFAKPQPNDGPVECLGMTFESDDARRAHFLGLLREKLQDPEFRKTPGFPTGSDDAILRMSDPPYYTACPNPFLDDFARRKLSTKVRHLVPIFRLPPRAGCWSRWCSRPAG
jgi:hypothetical protein